MAEWFGEAPAQLEGVRLIDRRRGPLHDVPRRRRRRTPSSSLLDDADEEVPRRQRRRLRAVLPGLDEGLGRDQGHERTSTLGSHRADGNALRSSTARGSAVASRAPARAPSGRAAGGCSPRRWCGSCCYIGSLVALLVTSFYTTDAVHDAVVNDVHARRTSADLLDEPVYRDGHDPDGRRSRRRSRSSTRVALPIAFFMAKVARRARRALVVGVLMPLWASYLVKAYAWRAILDPGGGVLDADRSAPPRVSA